MAKQVLPATKNKKLVENPQPVHLFAEREGFEPPVPLSTTVFKTVVIDHSTISPKGDKISASRMQRTCSLLRRSLISQAIFSKIGCKGKGIFPILQIFDILFCLAEVIFVPLSHDLPKELRSEDWFR